jgi:hypothetical protein
VARGVDWPSWKDCDFNFLPVGGLLLAEEWLSNPVLDFKEFGTDSDTKALPLPHSELLISRASNLPLRTCQPQNGSARRQRIYYCQKKQSGALTTLAR